VGIPAGSDADVGCVSPEPFDVAQDTPVEGRNAPRKGAVRQDAPYIFLRETKDQSDIFIDNHLILR